MTVKIKSIIEEERFLELADRYLPILTGDGGKETYKNYISHKLNNISKDEFLIPVLGVQGSGKSSLLNALLMDDLILPVDADETTCIPVEVRYGKDIDGQICVYLLDEKEPNILYEAKEIEQYVHNYYNYANQKNVSHIVIFKNDSILKEGLVFVDLPGVSSLTQGNVKTTMDYIEKLSAAIFLLRTVPPITRSERVFLSTAWPKLTKAWFIQNQWTDESWKEVNEGLKHNKDVLTEIARNHKTNENIDIRIVNVYKALNSCLQNDEVVMEESGIPELRNYISEIAKTWRTTIFEKFSDDIRLLVGRIKSKLEEQLRDSQLDRKTLRKKYREQERKFEDIINSNRDKISQIRLSIQRFETDLRNYAHVQSKKQAENLRNEMRRVTGNKVVDGDLLTRVLRENEQMFALDAIEGLNDKLFEVKKLMEVEIGDLEVRNMDDTYNGLADFYKESAFKYEKGLAPTIGIGGSITGIYAGLAIGTAIGGPVGTVVGGVVGIGISLFSSFIGKKTKEYVEDTRMEATMSDLEGPIEEFKDSLLNSINDHVDDYFTSINKSLEQFIAAQEKQLEADREEHRRNIKLSEEEIGERRQKIEDDLSYLEKIEVAI